MSGQKGVKELIDPLKLVPFVRNCCLKANVPKQLRDDAEQEGMAAVLERLKTFDPSRGVPFEGYAYRSVMTAIVRLLKRENRWAARFSQLDGDAEKFALSEIAPSVYSKQKPLEFDESLLDFLEPNEREVLDRIYFGAQDSGQVAEALGVTRRRVKQLQQSGVETLRLLCEYRDETYRDRVSQQHV